MLDWKTKTVGVLLPAYFAIAVLVTLLIGAAAVQADDSSKPVSPDGPPPGIVPVSIKLQTVLDANDAAVGRLAHKSITDVEEGTISAYGFIGTYKDVYAGLHSNDDFSSTTTLGPFTSGRGRLHGQRWRRDENGVTNVLQDTVRADEGDALGFIGDTENPKNDVSLLGEVTSPVSAYVVQVKRKGLLGFWSFYDKKTGLLDRVEVGSPDDRYVYTYDDYRLENGVRQAWHTHHSDGAPFNEYDSRITSDTYGVALTADDIAIPPTRQGIVQFPAGKTRVDVPADLRVRTIPFGINMTFADPYIRVTINGRGIDMRLDSTESGMVMDDQLAKEMGLTLSGPYEKDDKGRWYPTRTVVSTMSIGTLQMHDVAFALRPIHTQVGVKKIVGIIGYDVLANAVIEIDYVNQRVEAFDPAQFMPPLGSVSTPVNIDDGIPFVSAQVGASSGDNFLLDTTSPFTVIFPSFVRAHPDDVKDQGRGKAVSFLFKDLGMKATELKSLTFGGARFQEWLAFEFDNIDDFEGVTPDGVIGCDFLQYFNVYFDYGHHLVYLEPNATFKRAAHH
jgi:Aspartyl protease